MKTLLALVATGLLVAASATSASAAPILLNFDTDLGGNPLAGGTSLNAAYPGLGVTFSNNAVIVVGGGGVPSQPNFAAATPLYTGLLELIFDGVTDFVSAENVTNSSWTMTAYDVNNNVLGTQFVSNFPQTASISTPGIHRVTFTTNFQYGIDNLSFNAPTVPEPATMAVFGLMALGAFGLKRRTKITA
jgi:hypothetical protein